MNCSIRAGHFPALFFDNAYIVHMLYKRTMYAKTRKEEPNMKIVDYSIEGMNLKVEIDTNLDSEKRMTAYYIEAIRNETGMTRP